MGMLRTIISTEEPKQTTLLEEKRQQYQLDCTRLKELRYELSHFEHGEKKLEANIQQEFRQWYHAVEKRYPCEIATAIAAAAADTIADEEDDAGDAPESPRSR